MFTREKHIRSTFLKLHSTTKWYCRNEEPYLTKHNLFCAQISCCTKSFWADGLVTAAFIKNRLTCTGLTSTKSPHDVWHSKLPNVAHLQSFESKCLYHFGKVTSGIHGDKSCVAALVGFCSDWKAYKHWDTTEQKVVMSSNIVFGEYESGFANVEKDNLWKRDLSVTSSVKSQFETKLLRSS